MADVGNKAKLAILLGAGASVEARVPTAVDLTRIFSELSLHFGDKHAERMENLFRQVQVHIAEFDGIAASAVDFEAVLGVLVDLANGQSPTRLGLISERTSLVDVADGKTIRSAVDRFIALLRDYLSTDPDETDYLGGLLDLPRGRKPLDVFTLNYDQAFEQMLSRRRARFADGFHLPRRGFGFAVWNPDQFDRRGSSVRVHKLHGSLNWAMLQAGARPDHSRLGALEEYLSAYPTLVKLQAPEAAYLGLPGSADGPAMMINIGSRKELMYVARPFTELFDRFWRSLCTVDGLIIAGYGFRDERVNSLIEEATTRRKGELRLVVVDPRVFTTMDSLPTLMEFRASGVATLLNEGLGEALRSGAVSRALKRGRKPASVKHQQWATNLVVPDLPTKPSRSVVVITAWWMWLRRHMDGLVLREEELSKYRKSTDASRHDPSRLRQLILPLIAHASQSMRALDGLMECMSFGPYYGKARRATIRLEPKRMKKPATTEEIRRGLEQVSQWVGSAFLRYHYASEEFLGGIADPDYGRGAPDNFSMAELVSRDVSSGLDEVVYAVDRLLEALGYEPAFPKS